MNPQDFDTELEVVGGVEDEEIGIKRYPGSGQISKEDIAGLPEDSEDDPAESQLDEGLIEDDEVAPE